MASWHVSHHRLQQAIFRRRLKSWVTLNLRHCPLWLEPEFFATFTIVEAQCTVSFAS